MVLSLSTPVPMPADWTHVYAVLKKAWEAGAEDAIPAPPVPLILAGAAFSNASDIRKRWVELIDWANVFGFSENLAAVMPPPPLFDVAETIAGGDGWPNFGKQFHEPKKRHSKETVSEILKNIRKNWALIVGPEIAACTKPIKFKGHKLRSLLVAANPKVCPPWGRWYFVFDNAHAFTIFRKAINEAIVPMEVDHITFTTYCWGEPSGAVLDR